LELLPAGRWASNPKGLRGGARERASEAGRRPSLPADNAARKERCSESSVRSSSGPGWAWLLGRPRGLSASSLKLQPRRQSRLHSIMLSAKVSAGQAAWKLRSSAKAREGGDSRTERSDRVLVVTVGCRRWRDASSRRDGRGPRARDAVPGQLDVAALRRQQGPIRGG
jgi:hypothetical protein